MSDLTREEAIEILDDMKVKIDIPHVAVMQRKRNVALDMAILALKESSKSMKLSELERRLAE